MNAKAHLEIDFRTETQCDVSKIGNTCWNEGRKDNILSLKFAENKMGLKYLINS